MMMKLVQSLAALLTAPDVELEMILEKVEACLL
jgi:hypothetical protein